MSVRRRLVGALVAVASVAGLAVVASTPPAGAATVRSVGSVPVDDIIGAANAYKRPDCGLGADRLAAMMLAPVFHETGAFWYPDTSPSPMTLGRWDDRDALWAFGQRTTPYQRAFWVAGVGMWQFDSAGGWDMTAADAISTQTSANQAAATMAARYCASSAPDPVDRMKYAWSLWYACVSGPTNVCVDRFNEMFVGGQFTNIRRDPTVGRLGGAVPTTCRIGPTTQVACHRVDPAAAEGYVGWRAAAGGPTPLTAPFYVFRRDGREYRYWLAADTGYAQTVVAHKPVTANARTSLTWSLATAADNLCDLGTTRGACGTPRVASTPWGDKVADPFGSLDAATTGMGAIEVAGWTIDPDTSDPIDVHLYVDGRWGTQTTANVARSDVGRAVPGYGNAHGYTARIANLSPGTRRVCAYAINVGPFGATNPLLGCADVAVSAPPAGNLDLLRLAPGGATVSGWAADVDDTGSVAVEALVDGVVVATGTANQTRSDVGRTYPAFGSQRGVELSVPFDVGPSTRTICLDALDLPSGERQRLGCSTLSVPATPFGSLDAATPLDGGIEVAGWLIDWRSADPVPLSVTVDGVLAGTATADETRRDVAAVHRGFDERRGYDLVVPAIRGSHRVCVVAGGRTIGCADVDVATGDFADVPPTSYYADASRWLADGGITTGFPRPWLFSPAASLTRAQAVTFLWRLMGSPDAPAACGWADPIPTWAQVPACWARQTGVVSGVGGDPARFAADAGITRAELAVMLWRMVGQPVPVEPTASLFSDVAGGRWFSDAVAWMAETGVSTGSTVDGSRVFDPAGPVTRAHVAAFLWRLAGTPNAWAVPRPPTATR